MKDFQGKVAVVTGAASGIGRALAERSAQEGMKLVLADVEEKALAQTELQNDPSEVKPYPAYEADVQATRQSVETGIPAQQVADCVFDAIRGERFYILTHPWQSLVQARMEDILQDRLPTNPLA